MTRELEGQRAFVTGASSGIGQACAYALAKEGAAVVVHGRTVEKLSETLTTLRDLRAPAFPIVADFEDEAAIKPMCDEAMGLLGGIDIVVNNAGMDLGAYSVIDTDPAAWDTLYRVNLKAYFLVSKYLGRRMVDQKRGGRFIFIGSIAGKIAQAELAHYNSAKIAVIGLARSFAAEMGAHGITVNTICPGFTETKLNAIIFQDMAQQTGRRYEEIHDEAMMNNMLKAVIMPEDIGHLCAFLASPRARCITGQDINVCAGMCLW